MNAKNILYKNLLIFNLFIFFFTSYFVWITLMNVGPVDVRLYHLCFFTSLPLWQYSDFKKGIKVIINKYKWIIISYSILNFLYILSILWSRASLGGLVFSIKSVTYFYFFFIFSGIIVETIRLGLYSTIGKMAIYGILAFMAGIFLIFISQGKSFIGSLIEAIATGNSTKITYGVLSVIFKFNFIKMESEEDWSNSRNTLALALAISFVCSYCFTVRRKILYYFAAVVSAVGTLLTLSRSGQLYLLSSLFVIINSKIEKKLMFILGFIFIPIIIILFLTNDTLQTILLDRYKTEEEEPRIIMYNKALVDLTKSPLLGYGIGTQINYALDNGSTKSLFVHNFILGSWYAAGISGLVVSLLFVLLLLTSVYKSYIFLKRLSLMYSIPAGYYLILIFPFFTLIRMMFGGNYGNPGILEWGIIALHAGFFTSLKAGYIHLQTKK